MERRGLLSRLAFLPLLAGAAGRAGADEQKRPLKIMLKSAWGSDDPTKAAFAFLHGNALARGGAQRADIPARGGRVVDARLGRARRRTSRLAAPSSRR